MKIGIDITQAQYVGTGVGTYTYNLAKALLDIDQKNHYIMFGGSLRGYQDLKKIAASTNAQETKIFPLPPLFMDALFNRIHKPTIEFFTGYLDVFHASDWTHPATKSAKTITTIHDLTTIKFPENHHKKTIDTHKRRLNWALTESSAIIVDSYATKNDLIDIFGVSEEKINVIYLAANQSVLDFSKLTDTEKNRQISRIKAKYNLINKYVLSLGTNEPRKNLDRVVQAFTESDLTEDLVIAGRYGWGEKIKKSPGVKILGFVPEEDLPPIIAGASCFIYPSLYEGFGLPVLEAMTLGVPVVTSDQGSLKEIADKSAVNVDPYSSASITNGIKKALINPTNFIKLGYAQSQKFSWQQTAKQTLAVYEKVYN